MGAHLKLGRRPLLACLLAALAGAAPASAVVSTESRTWGTDNEVEAVARSGNTVYLGGRFTRVGPISGNAASLAKSDGTYDPATPRIAGINNQVFASAPDGAGGWYVAGGFSSVGGVARTNLAHIRADNTVDPAFAATFSAGSSVRAMAALGSKVYIGGSFTSVDGVARNGLAAIGTDGTLDPSWHPNPKFGTDPGTVASVAASSSRVYVGGFFDSIGGQARSYLASLEPANGTATGTASATFPAADNQVSALAVDGSEVYAGGAFTHILTGATTPPARAHLAAIDGTTETLDASWNPGTDGSGVFALAVGSAGVYAGGLFTHAGGGAATTRSNLALLEPANASNTGDAESWDPAPDGLVLALALDGDTTYVGGQFFHIGAGTPEPRSTLAAVDSSGDAIDWDPRLAPYGSSTWGVSSISQSASRIYAGGSFELANTISRGRLAAFDATTGTATDWNPPDPDQDVAALAVSGSTLYAGGGFQNVGAFARKRIAAFDTSTGDVNPDWHPDADNAVADLIVTGSTVYAGGFFDNIGGAAREKLAALDAVGVGNGHGDAVAAWDPSTGAVAVKGLALAGSTLYAAALGSDGAVLALDAGGSAAPLPGWTVPHFDSTIEALAVSGSSLFIGGNFTTFNNNGTERDNLAAVNATSGSLLAWNPAADGGVSALATTGSSVYAGGSFSTVGGEDRNLIAELDAGSGAASGWDPNIPFGTVDAIVLGSDGTLHVGGDFRRLHGFNAGSVPQLGYVQFGPSPPGPAQTPGGGPAAPLFAFSPPAGPPLLDRLAPHAKAAATKSQRVLKQGGLIVFVTQDEDGTDTANATVSISTGAKVYKFKQATKAVRAGKKTKLKLGLSKKLRKALVKGLGQKRKLTAKVTITATDRAGNRTTLRRGVKLKR